jgi:aminoglycoside 3-N-acetyltransferase
MNEVTTAQVQGVLCELGLGTGDGVLVHSALHFLGRPENGVRTYLEAVCRVINIPLPSLTISADSNLPAGTLVVPAFNFGFARGIVFDPDKTPADGMGVFSEAVRQLPEARRTPHPLQSLVAIGGAAADLAGRDTPSAFDPGSAFERLLDLDFSILLLGADIQAVSLLHYSEQRLAVPYRYWKEFTGQIRTNQGLLIRTYRMYVRDLTIDPQLKIIAIQEKLAERGLWQQVKLNYGWVSLCKARHFVAVADELLAADPWIFVAERRV